MAYEHTTTPQKGWVELKYKQYFQLFIYVPSPKGKGIHSLLTTTPREKL
jgi:hypothetical protein